MFTIDLETHFYTKAAFDYLSKRSTYPLMVPEPNTGDFNLRFSDQIALFQNKEFIESLCDIGEQRIKLMDEAGLDVQVLSFSTPGVDELADDVAKATILATEINRLLWETTKKYPNRFMGFAAIAPHDVQHATKELEHCINELNFSGWLAHANFGKNNYLDNKIYWPLLETAESLDIPIYIHPTTPLSKEYGLYGFSLAGPPLGFQSEAALCLLRMIYAGVFDQFPKLKIILGHLGETIPFLIPDRIDWAYSNPISKSPGFIKQRPAIKKTPSEVIKDNVFVTTSGRFSKPTLDFTLQVMGEDKVLLATDYPYENLKESLDFIRGCQLSDSVLHKITHANAEKIGFISKK